MKGAPRINATSPKEHVQPVERWIRVVKEQARAMKHSLPPKIILLMMTITMVFALHQHAELVSKQGRNFQELQSIHFVDWTEP